MSALLLVLKFLLDASAVQAYFVLSQPILETTRLDPIVSPGQISGHVHVIAGGSNFNRSMTYESARQSQCTTAPMSLDLSNYWVPQLYYYSPSNQTYQAIPVYGMNAYYLPRAGSDGKVSAFPNGLQMVQGNPNRRTYDGTADSASITYVCLDYNNNHQGDPAWYERNNFFEHNCPDGLRAQVFFRSCWDGVHVTSPDHVSHMAWPSGGVNGGDCPASHPVRLVSLFYEFIFAVQNFPFNNGSDPTWVWANGDTTGYGFHGDFLSGWPELINGTNILQQAIDGCNANNGVGGELNNCPPFVPYLNSSLCLPENPLVNEDIGMGHYISRLPGDNPIWIGNGTKPTYANYTDANTTVGNPQSVIPAGYSFVGCVAEGTSGRALTGASYTGSNVTRGACVAFCESYGYPLAGMEYGSQCYCDYQMRNGASNTTLLDNDEKCDMKCANNAYESCGGPNALTLFNNPSLYPAAEVLPAGWVNSGCVTEAINGRALASYSISSSSMNHSMCIAACSSQGYKYAGVEYASQCFCGNILSTGSVNASSTDCNMACSGNSRQLCGGPDRLTLFTNTKAPSSTPVLPTGWTANGCWTEANNMRALANYSYASNNMTAQNCIAACSSRGYKYAGAEYASQCYCGNVFQSGSVQAATSDCNMACTGASAQFCGGPNRLTTWVNQTWTGDQ
ncbi:hypothetical protein BD324DRAFT_578097 [Kockovaella imperatae]|uniref:WSC domain-containing protein n=1 Tax=Kockovaella imperatae TaxID=4999 RepID=A0A1Y1UMK4_9TREE|nr:hypothetical protein BD324DRAFT_578097 [Kockovaella imperatae]ORX38365.1 hypothetical protein BD324DRAFT_578097 [Kockovaella imperatae]